jgi:hypothetical protein
MWKECPEQNILHDKFIFGARGENGFDPKHANQLPKRYFESHKSKLAKIIEQPSKCQRNCELNIMTSYFKCSCYAAPKVQRLHGKQNLTILSKMLSDKNKLLSRTKNISIKIPFLNLSDSLQICNNL